ncbi:Hypothetical predicted protein [Mytilus galloprovincialis]|uniref:Uncharacterized protein n=1 Tax=Mytilus galloprovincialis TaxID=29158 RepID=A0A8B6F6T6_MYTGA|nr:Hypothetical predicted protein [Mytilus galloprovincialis]
MWNRGHGEDRTKSACERCREDFHSACNGLVSYFNGIVPDYMHGVLLGVTKKMLGLMTSSSNSGEAYFVGKNIKKIDDMLMEMKPTDAITRLPRKLEEHYHNFKASEFQILLLFYLLPCMQDLLSKQYLDHLALFVEGVYLLLGDDISFNQLNRAELVLKLFYLQFKDLYGKNHMTLNLHNVGQHLCYYVRKLGPLWAWSCFPFEDMNGTILEQVHGTGNVCLQILWTLQVQKKLVVDSVFITNPIFKGFVDKMVKVGRHVKIKAVAANCKIAGSMTIFKPDNVLTEKLKTLFSVDTLGNLFKVLRIFKGDEIFISEQYTRMAKRISYIVSLDPETGVSMGAIQYFIYHGDTNSCVAVIKPIFSHNTKPLLHASVHHLIQINKTFNDRLLEVVKVQSINQKLLYISGNEKNICVSRLPKLFGM